MARDTGFAALNDATLTRKFGDIARQEYLAVGITQALSPQADLATEPRWARINGTFGEDADVAKAQVQAYIEGFQGGSSGLTNKSVLAVVKHWVATARRRMALIAITTTVVMPLIPATTLPITSSRLKARLPPMRRRSCQPIPNPMPR